MEVCKMYAKDIAIVTSGALAKNGGIITISEVFAHKESNRQGKRYAEEQGQHRRHQRADDKRQGTVLLMTFRVVPLRRGQEAEESEMLESIGGISQQGVDDSATNDRNGTGRQEQYDAEQFVVHDSDF